MGQWIQGDYIVENISKFVGNDGIVKYKSSLEKRVCYYLDHNVNVLNWSYERHKIPYNKPIFNSRGKIDHIEIRQYFLDFWCDIKDNTGNTKRYLIEVKSLSETKPPIEPKKKTPKAMHRYMTQCMTFLINQAKWKEAEKYCNSKNWYFILLTDDKIY